MGRVEPPVPAVRGDAIAGATTEKDRQRTSATVAEVRYCSVRGLATDIGAAISPHNARRPKAAM